MDDDQESSQEVFRNVQVQGLLLTSVLSSIPLEEENLITGRKSQQESEKTIEPDLNRSVRHKRKESENNPPE